MNIPNTYTRSHPHTYACVRGHRADYEHLFDIDLYDTSFSSFFKGAPSPLLLICSENIGAARILARSHRRLRRDETSGYFLLLHRAPRTRKRDRIFAARGDDKNTLWLRSSSGGAIFLACTFIEKSLNGRVARPRVVCGRAAYVHVRVCEYTCARERERERDLWYFVSPPDNRRTKYPDLCDATLEPFLIH